MHNEAVIEDVSDTAFWVAYFRAKESDNPQPLFRDPLAKLLAGARGKALAEARPEISRYTEWTVVARTVIIDRLIEQAMKEDIDCVINLGAGLDTRPYRMQLPENLPWIEADYPNIVQFKNDALQAEQPHCRLSRVALDLSDENKRREFLDNVAPDAKRILVLTEGVIPYLSEDEVAALARDLFARQRFIYWITEYFHERLYAPLQSVVKRGGLQKAPFKFFPPEWYAFFARFGWTEKETRYFDEIAAEFGRKSPMPKMARFIIWFLPKKLREQTRRFSGFVIFRRRE